MTIPLFKVGMSPEAARMLQPVLESGFIGQGPKVEEFEACLNKQMGLIEPSVLSMNSCTSALDMALHLAGIGPGDLVLSSPITCLASNAVIHNRGATIAWLDVDPLTGNVSAEDLDRCLKLYPEAKAAMFVDWAGRVSVTPEVASIADSHRQLRTGGPLWVIEDAAHAFDASDKEASPVGFYADYCAWSFQAIKHLTTGDGGALLCPQGDYARAKLLRWYGLDRTTGTAMRCVQVVPEIGMKYQMNDLAATIGIANLPLALDHVRQSRKNAWSYQKKITNPVLTLPPYEDGCSYWLYTLLVGDNRRDEFLSYCKSMGIEASLVHVRNDVQTALRTTNGHKLPGVDRFSAEEACIPVGFWLTEEEIDYIIKVLNDF